MRCVPHVVMAVVLPIQFSPNGEYLAYSGPDGSLRIWETSTGKQKHEYIPSSHLSATCTCISWSSTRTEHMSRKKKRRKSEITKMDDDYKLIAMGTTSGTVLIYSFSKGDLQSQLEGGHVATVNCVCWNSDQDTVFSCSDDQHIVEWCLSTATVKEKWKADKHSVYSISLCHSRKHLLSAGRTIKLWDIETKQVLKTFSGHASEVVRLMHVNNSLDGEPEKSIEGSYFLSSAVGERSISAWQINTSSNDKKSLASFSLPDEATYIAISSPRREGEKFLLLAVTKSGDIILFEHILNGRCKLPLQPKATIKVASDKKSGSPKPVPILSGFICDNDEREVLFAHGNFLKPTFEKMSSASIQPETCLLREDPSTTVLQVEKSVSTVNIPEVSEDLTVLAPGHMAPSLPGLDGNDNRVNKKRRKSQELSMEERLNAIGIDQPSQRSAASASLPPKADALASLLAQGLRSQDKKILNNVLQHTNETIIRNTVKRLPIPVIVPLVQELTKRMHGHAQSGSTLVKWVKTVLTSHTSYLMTFPELVESMGSLYQMMDSRVTVFGRLSKLQGKLDLMLSQITSQTQEEEETVGGQQPMLVYQDDSSDDDLGIEEGFPDHSESEDNWEDMSDQDNNKDDESESEQSHMDDSDSEDKEMVEENGTQ